MKVKGRTITGQPKKKNILKFSTSPESFLATNREAKEPQGSGYEIEDSVANKVKHSTYTIK